MGGGQRVIAGDTRSVAPHADERVGALDTLRVLAVGVVIAYHLDRLPGGWIGVDLFFVLSGYLITTLLLRSRRRGQIALAGFWGRRARRLLPAALACIAGTLVAGLIFEPDAVGSWARTGAAAALWVGNWQQVLAGSSYFDAFAVPNALKHTWSLSVEEQFYVVWPLILVTLSVTLSRRRVGARHQAIAFTVVALALAAVSAALMWLLAPDAYSDPTRVWYGSDTRAMTPLVGAALAGLVSARGWPSSTRGRDLIDLGGVLGLAAIAVATVAVDDHSTFLWHGGSLAIAFACALVIAAAAQPGRLRDWLSRPRPVVWIGAALSYALYLWHWPVIVILTPERMGFGGAALDIVRVGVSFGFALLSWRFVEQPVRTGALRQRVAGRRATVLALGAVTAVVVAGCGVALTHPTVAERMDEIVADATGDPSGLLVLAPAAMASQDPIGSAPAHRPPMRLSLYGDSVAWSYSAKAQPEVLADHHTAAVFNRSDWFCQLFTVDRKEGDRIKPGSETKCEHWPQEWPLQIANDRPDVALLSIGVWEVFDRKFDGEWVAFGTPEFDQRFDAALDQALTILGSTGARVAVTTAPYPNRPEAATQSFEWRDNPASRARFDHLNERLRAAAARHDGLVVDLARYLCPTADGPCRPDDMRYDGVHFIPDESPPQIFGFVLDSLWEQLGPPPASR